MQTQVASLLTLLAVPTVCLADLSTSISIRGELGGVMARCSDGGSSTASCGASANGTYLGGPGLATVSVSGSADAGYGALFVDVSAFLNPDGGFSGSATASFSDALTVLGGSGAGYISYFFDGSITSITDIAGNFFEVQGGGIGVNTWENTIESFNYQTPFYPFTFGVPFTLSGSAQARTVGTGDGYGRGTVDINLYNIVVLNQDHQPIPFTITAESGTVYPGQTPVPEPSSLLLGATLVVLTGGVLQKRRRAAVPRS